MLYSDLIQALKTPFAIAGQVMLLASVIAYSLTFLIDSSRRVLVRQMALVAAAFSLIVTGMVAEQSAHQLESDREYKALHAVYSVQASVEGVVTNTVLSDPITFRVSSGQVNVGCNDTQSTNAIWPIPQGAQDVQASATWEGTNNVKTLTQIVDPSPPVIKATGVISGLDKNFFGNCAGGGHGELVLKGSYRIPNAQAFRGQTLKTLDDKVNRGQPFIIAVPHDARTRPSSCDISVQEGSRKKSVHIDLSVLPDDTLRLSNRVTTKQVGEDIPMEITMESDRIVLRIL